MTNSAANERLIGLSAAFAQIVRFCEGSSLRAAELVQLATDAYPGTSLAWRLNRIMALLLHHAKRGA